MFIQCENCVSVWAVYRENFFPEYARLNFIYWSFFFCGQRKDFSWKLHVVSHFIMWCNMRDFSWAFHLKPSREKREKLWYLITNRCLGFMGNIHKKFLLGPKKELITFFTMIGYWKPHHILLKGILLHSNIIRSWIKLSKEPYFLTCFVRVSIWQSIWIYAFA